MQFRVKGRGEHSFQLDGQSGPPEKRRQLSNDWKEGMGEMCCPLRKGVFQAEGKGSAKVLRSEHA